MSRERIRAMIIPKENWDKEKDNIQEDLSRKQNNLKEINDEIDKKINEKIEEERLVLKKHGCNVDGSEITKTVMREFKKTDEYNELVKQEPFFPEIFEDILNLITQRSDYFVEINGKKYMFLMATEDFDAEGLGYLADTFNLNPIILEKF